MLRPAPSRTHMLKHWWLWRLTHMAFIFARRSYFLRSRQSVNAHRRRHHEGRPGGPRPVESKHARYSDAPKGHVAFKVWSHAQMWGTHQPGLSVWRAASAAWPVQTDASAPARSRTHNLFGNSGVRIAASWLEVPCDVVVSAGVGWFASTNPGTTLAPSLHASSFASLHTVSASPLPQKHKFEQTVCMAWRSNKDRQT